MQASLFYQTDERTSSIPLVLLSQAQWEARAELIPAVDRACLESEQFTAETGRFCLVHSTRGDLSTAYVGTGEGKEVKALAMAATQLPESLVYRLAQEVSSEALLAWSLAQYRFDAYKKQTNKARVLFVNKTAFPALLAEAEAIFLIRDLINRPTNDLGPTELALETKNLAEQYQAHFEEWVGDGLLTANFPAIHAVGRASVHAPRLLSLTWGNEQDPRITLVGKGVCFDSGGLDLKPASAMRLMKKDMGGAAHVLGLAKWIMQTGLPIRLQVFIPAVENAVGSNAFRPGDILTMRNGLTVEIDNTDAEGRLILADALVKACEDSPQLLIDFSTLTGAARVAVGTEIAAMFTPDEALAQTLQQSAESTHDPIWRLPLFAGYKGLLDSNVADLMNSSPSAYAGAITAGLFLQHFVSDSCPWVHFDIMAWNVTNKPGKPEGGEAMAFRAVAHYLQQYCANKM